MELNSLSLESWCWAMMWRTVPDLDRITRDSVVGHEDGLEVVAGLESGLALLVRQRPQATLELATHALESGGGDDAFGGPADAEQDVGAGVGPRRGHGAGHVPVGDEADAGA